MPGHELRAVVGAGLSWFQRLRLSSQTVYAIVESGLTQQEPQFPVALSTLELHTEAGAAASGRGGGGAGTGDSQGLASAVSAEVRVE